MVIIFLGGQSQLWQGMSEVSSASVVGVVELSRPGQQVLLMAHSTGSHHIRLELCGWAGHPVVLWTSRFGVFLPFPLVSLTRRPNILAVGVNSVHGSLKPAVSNKQTMQQNARKHRHSV